MYQTHVNRRNYVFFLETGGKRECNLWYKAPGNIIGKGIVILSNGKGKAKNVLFVDGLKHNLLSVYYMCDQAYDMLFEIKSSQIKFAGTCEVVGKPLRINSKVYVLKEKTKRCFLSNIDENLVWHKILWRLNFDHIVRLGKQCSQRSSKAVKA